MRRDDRGVLSLKRVSRRHPVGGSKEKGTCFPGGGHLKGNAVMNVYHS